MWPAVPTMTLLELVAIEEENDSMLRERRIRGQTRCDSVGCGARIGGSQNRAAHYDVVGSSFNRFEGRSGAGLIIFLRFSFRIFRTHAWRDNQEFATARFANRLGLLHTSDHAIDARSLGS